MNKDFKQTSRSGSVAWLLQRISAVILFVLLLLHFVTYHFLGKGKAVNYQWVDVQGRQLVVPAAAVRLPAHGAVPRPERGLVGPGGLHDEQVLAPGLVQPAADGRERCCCSSAP